MALVELLPERHAFISELAEDVWQTYSRERLVFLDGIVNAVGATLSYGDYGDAFDGLIEHKNTAFHIYCNTARGQPCNSPRARFTIGHELGHFFIDEHRNALLAGKPPHSSFTEHPADNPVEVEANLFSANLLMPRQEFRKALTEVRQGLDGIIDLASIFGVSIQASALRYTAQSQKPCAIVMFRESGKPWWDISSELKSQGYRWVQKLNSDLIPADSATGLAMRDGTATLGIAHQNGTVASAWFTGIAKGGRFDEMFAESAIRLASRGVLTLIERCGV
ncbi:MAG: ImmA/IrrE family metallo-endopeptidase [Verrucomicrobiota bacterium]